MYPIQQAAVLITECCVALYAVLGCAGLVRLFCCSVRITSPSDLLHYGIATHYIPQTQLQVCLVTDTVDETGSSIRCSVGCLGFRFNLYPVECSVRCLQRYPLATTGRTISCAGARRLLLRSSTADTFYIPRALADNFYCSIIAPYALSLLCELCTAPCSMLSL
jgi:hypothetical protein